MKCGKPIVMAGKAFGCGQCLPCRLNKRRIWTHRIMLESLDHGDNTFVTLSYNDEHLPEDGNVSIDEYQRWLKRLRKQMHPITFRFFLTGEYGDESWRPHYHAILFGVPNCLRGQTLRRNGRGRSLWEKCCESCRLVGRTWGKGDVYLGALEESSAQYVAKYTVKKMTRDDDPRLEGRFPEFARMSRRPYGIGATAMEEVASVLLEFDLHKTQVDVPNSLRHGSKILPVGRYLQRRLRKLVGHDEKTPDRALAILEEEMRDVWAHVKAGTEGPTTIITARRKANLDKAVSRVRFERKGTL